MEDLPMNEVSVLTKLLTSGMGSQDRRTPKALFEFYNKKYQFQLDAATSTQYPGNLGTPHYFWYNPDTKEGVDALSQSWSEYGSIFVNPPFRKMMPWVKKAKEESEKGSVVVMLVPVKADTAWWHYALTHATQIEFVRGRVTFEGHDNPFIIGIAMLIFDGRCSV